MEKQSNSKLTKEQKAWLKTAKSHVDLVFGVSGSVTVCVIPHSTIAGTGTLGISYASPNEKKIRRKVGEYHAAQRAMKPGASPFRWATEYDAAQDAGQFLAEHLMVGVSKCL